MLALSTISFNFDVLLPLLAGQTLDADADVFGLIAAVFGAGALCGALFLATLGKASLRLLLGGALRLRRARARARPAGEPRRRSASCSS